MSNRKILNAASTGGIGYYPVGNPTDAYYDNVSLLLNGDVEVDGNFANVSLLLDGNTIADKSNNKAAITVNGNAVVSNTTKKFGTGSLYFDGNGDSVSAPYNSGYYLNSADTFTIEMWINPTALVAGTTPRLLNIGTYASSDYLIIDFIVNSNLLRFGMETTSGTGISNWVISYTGIPPLNTWTHIAFVCSGLGANQTKLYINGTLAASGTSASSMGTNGALWVGGITWASATTYCYSGYIDDLRITKGVARYTANFTPPVKALPTHEILDSSVYRLPVTIYGNARIDTATKKFGTGAMYFDGSGDYCTLPASPALNIGAGDFTIELWCWYAGTSWPSNNDLLGTGGYYTAGKNGNWAFSVRNSTQIMFVIYNAQSDTTGGVYDFTVPTITVQAWHHIAVTRLNGLVNIWVDGVKSVTSLTNNTAMIDGEASGLKVGGYIYPASPNYFYGYIDDVRITKGIARYTANFPPGPTASLPTIPPTIPADPWWGNVSLLLDGNTTDAYDPYWQNVSLMLTGDDFIDWSNQHNAVTNNGTVTLITTTKKFNSSSYGLSSGKYLSIPNNANLYFGAGDFTIELWFNFSTIPTAAASFLSLYDNAANNGWAVQFRGEANNVFRFGNGDTTLLDSPSQTLSINRWYYLAVTRSGTSLKLFLDGSQIGNTTNSTSLTSVQPMTIGGLYFNGIIQQFSGYLADLRITKGIARTITVPTTALPSYKIQDRTQNNLSVTPYGNVQLITDVMRYGTGSMFFDGTGDYINIAGSSATNLTGVDFTVECWLYHNTLGSGTYYKLFNWDSPNDYIFEVTKITSTTFNLGVYCGGLYIVSSSSSPANCNQWNHIAFVRNGNTGIFFINGVLINSVAFTPTTVGSNNGMSIGRGNYYGDNYYLNGYIDDFRITKGYARYTQNFTPPSQSFATQYISTGYDANYADVSLLLNGNGTNGSTTFTDLSSSPKTVTAYGNAQISTTQKKYGTGAIAFDGTGDYLATPSTPNLSFGSGDFTIEAWVYASSLGSFNAVFAQWPDNGGTSNNSYVLESVGSSMDFYCAASGSVISATLGTITTGSWIHYAICRSGNTLYPFKNGVLGTTVSITQTLNSPTSAVTVGGNVAGSGFWNGYIDDLRITKGVARYTTNFTPPTYQLPTDTTGTVIDPLRSSTSLLLRGNGTNGSTSFVDESTNGLTVNRYGSVVISTAQKKYGTGAIYSPGDFTGNYLTVASNSLIDLAGGQWTVEMWVYPTTATLNNRTLFSKRGSVGCSYQGYVRNGTNTIGFYNGTEYDSGVSFTANVWCHIAYIYDGSTVKIYKDGTQIFSSAIAAGANNSYPLYIGAYLEAGFNEEWPGYIDDFRITKGYARYTANFTPPTYEDPIVTGTVYDYNYPQVSLLLNGDGTNGSTVFKDLSSTPKTITNNGSVAINTSVKKFGTGSLLFNNAASDGQYLQQTSSSITAFGTSDFTIDLWVYPTAISSSHINTIFDSSAAGGPTLHLSTDGRLNFVGNATDYMYSTAYLSINTWYHVAVVKSSGIIKIYLNGTLTSTYSTATTFTGPYTFTVGSQPGYGRWFQGYIDDLRITKGLARYTQNFTPPTAPLPTSYS